MLTHQVIQDMHQDFKLIKMVSQSQLRETPRMKKTKLKPSQHYQLAMVPTELRELTALIESHFQCAQEIKSQRLKKVSLLIAEYYQHVIHKTIKWSHQHAIKPER